MHEFGMRYSSFTIIFEAKFSTVRRVFVFNVNSTNYLSLSGECRVMPFPAFYFFDGKRLVNHVVRTEQVPDIDICELLCYQEHNCVSVNFKNNEKKCELSNSTHREHDKDFVDTPGYFYHGSDVRIIYLILLKSFRGDLIFILFYFSQRDSCPVEIS